MRRFHAIEWEDFKWFPPSWRNYSTNYLKFVATKFNVYQSILPLMQRCLDNNKNVHWVDLCSGGGSGLVYLAKELKKNHANLKITLTDYYPNIKAFKILATEFPGTFLYEVSSVDAAEPPVHLQGTLQTIFGAFHHFRPKKAKQILQNAINTNTTIAIFEPVGRNLTSLLAMFFVPLNVLFFTLFIRPVQYKVLPFIYIIPIIPLYILWDGIASILRTYSEEELFELVDSLENVDSFQWEIGKTSSKMPIYYLLGYKKSKK